MQDRSLHKAILSTASSPETYRLSFLEPQHHPPLQGDVGDKGKEDTAGKIKCPYSLQPMDRYLRPAEDNSPPGIPHCYNVDALLEGKQRQLGNSKVPGILGVLVSILKSLWRPPLGLYFILYNRSPFKTPVQLLLPTGSCPRALIKSPFCTKHTSRILSWPPAPDAPTPPKSRQVHLRWDL